MGDQISTSMKKALRFLAIFLLLFNGIGAVISGWILMIDPSGVQMQLPADYLAHIPFKDYFIPGLILFMANGLLSMVITVAVATKHWLHPQLIALQGIILTGWIAIQVIMVQDTYFLHYIMGSIGLALIGLGILLYYADFKREYTHSKRTK